ncbi:MAG TPA: hypothetical protein VFY45_11530 [Baekduia sp.]|nr:hypothetical protein [Baekduia sp.]
MPAPTIGTQLGSYRIEVLLGRGGMGVVYRAEGHLRLGRKVALKLLASHITEDEHFRTRFLAESRLAASIDHAGIVPIYDAGESDGHLYIAMRLHGRRTQFARAAAAGAQPAVSTRRRSARRISGRDHDRLLC